MFELSANGDAGGEAPFSFEEHIKTLIQRANPGDIEELQFRMNGKEYSLIYAGLYYNTRQALSWRIRLEVYQALVLGVFEKFKNHLVLCSVPPVDLSLYQGQYILDTTRLETCLLEAPASTTQKISSTEVLFYVNETEALEPILIKNCAQLKRRINDLTDITLHLSRTEFKNWITENGGHTQIDSKPELYRGDLAALKEAVFCSAHAYFLTVFNDLSKEKEIFQAFARKEDGTSTAEFDPDATQRYGICFGSAWLTYMNFWLQDKSLSEIEKILERQYIKWQKITEEASIKESEYRTKKGERLNDFHDITTAIAAESSLPLSIPIHPLTPLDSGGTTPLHLALSSKNKDLITLFLNLISAQKEVCATYGEILALNNAEGESIETLFNKMNIEGVVLKAELQTCCRSIPGPLSPLSPLKSITSLSVPGTRRYSVLSGPIPATDPECDDSPIFADFLEHLNKTRPPFSGPYLGRISEFLCSLIHAKHSEALTVFIDPIQKLDAQRAIAMNHADLLMAGQNQDDYLLDLFNLWSIHLEYKFHKIIHDQLTDSPAPIISSNDDLERIRDHAFLQIRAISIDLFFKYDRSRKGSFKEQKMSLTPILNQFLDAFEIRERGLSARIFDGGKALESNIKALSDLRTLLEEKEKDYRLARQACPSHEEIEYLAISIWIQEWQRNCLEKKNPLPFSVDMAPHALNKDILYLINFPAINLLLHRDKLGNTLLHLALWKRDLNILELLLNLLPPEQMAEALVTRNQFEMTLLQVANYQKLPECIKKIIDIKKHLSGSDALSPEEKKQAEKIEQVLTLYPSVIDALQSLVANLDHYQRTVMHQKEKLIDNLHQKKTWTQLFNWLSIHLSGKNQLEMYEARRQALADLSPILSGIETTLKSDIPTATGRQIFAQLAELYPLIEHILASPKMGRSRFAEALSPIKIKHLSALSPFFMHLDEASKQATPPRAHMEPHGFIPADFFDLPPDYAGFQDDPEP